MSENLQAYCVKCKTKRDMLEPKPEYTRTGQPGTRGKCPVCGTTLFKMGNTPAHAGIPKPEVIEKPKKKKKSGKKASKKTKQVRRKGKLVIVESPAKARTVGRYLGKGYTVKASIGHVRDLLRSKLSVDVENDFEPKYRVPNEKRDVVKELKAASAKAEEIYVATDPDREGEAIAWHLVAAAEMDEDRVRRVVFHEITKPAIEEAFSHTREINMELVNAQQARRILDRLVGYNITELLWEKVRNGLSAGRVQSVALRMVVDREREIRVFVPKEYWSIAAELAKQPENGSKELAGFTAKLLKIADESFELNNEDEVKPHLETLEKSQYKVAEVKDGTRQRRPAPPFTTSTMQQEASRRLRFNASRTMRVAQQLYEGIDIGEDTTGLITYMRTDSTAIASEAQQQARHYISSTYGDSFMPKEPPNYKTKAKNAQEAHEAIRPTDVKRTPDALKDRLSRDQYRLYTLIWQRFVASQMSNAVYTTRRVDVLAGLPEDPKPPYLFRATGSSIKFQGFLRVYEESKDDDASSEDDEESGNNIPELSVNALLKLIKLLPRQHFTQPPPRYTEASLVRALEENGIGRPSTYAPTVAVIQNRDYATREGRHLIPTETGELVNDMLVQFFPGVMNFDFTAQMEDRLDEIATGDKTWVPILREFYDPFEQELDHAKEHMPQQRQEIPLGRDCPECGNPLVIKYGRYGKFIGCSNYPDCRHTEPWLEKIGVTCPQDGGEIVEKKSRKGRTFYGCANYPDCDFTSWKRPLPQPCPNCGGMLVQQNKEKAQCTVCEHQYQLEELPEVPAAAGEPAASPEATVAEPTQPS